MAEFRNFQDYRKKSNDTDDDQTRDSRSSYEVRIRNHKLRVFYRTVLMAAAAVAIIVIVYINWKGRVYKEARLTDSVKVAGMEGSTVMPLGDTVLRYSKDGISCISPDGSGKWDLTFEMQTPVVRTCEDTVAVGDSGGNRVYVAGTSGRMGEIDTSLPIRDFCVSSQGIVAALLADGDVSRINLYDTSGKELATVKATMVNSGYPAAVSLSPNGELLAVSYVGIADGNIESRVTFYNFGNVGQNKTDNMVSSFKYPGVFIPYDVFISSDMNFAAADDRVLFFKGKEVPNNPVTSLIKDKEILSIFHGDGKVGLVCTGTTAEGKYELLIYNEEGELVLSMPFNTEYSGVLFDEDQFVIYNENECELYDMKVESKSW